MSRPQVGEPREGDTVIVTEGIQFAIGTIEQGLVKQFGDSLTINYSLSGINPGFTVTLPIGLTCC